MLVYEGLGEAELPSPCRSGNNHWGALQSSVPLASFLCVLPQAVPAEYQGIFEKCQRRVGRGHRVGDSRGTVSYSTHRLHL